LVGRGQLLPQGVQAAPDQADQARRGPLGPAEVPGDVRPRPALQVAQADGDLLECLPIRQCEKWGRRASPGRRSVSPSQHGVDQWQQLLGGVRVAVLGGGQDARDLAHED
jgi:hypothetical protein